VILVNRNRVPAPPVLAAQNARAAQERARAATFFSVPKAQRKGTFTFRIYKDESVKAALEALFLGKCAYCESRYTATQPLDVEHWRPKSDVKLAAWETCTDFTGYYWLASEWDNLLASCIDCNRRRKQIDAFTGGMTASGKATAFPIRDATQRAGAPGELATEQPLLLNPCVEDPSDHLQPHPDDESLLVAKRGSDRGTASIEVYGLNRAGLVLARREQLFRVRHHLYQLTKLLELAPRTRGRRLYLVEELIARELAVLAAMRRTSEPYSLMNRTVIDGYLRETLGITP
jgi:hypothetical protein